MKDLYHNVLVTQAAVPATTNATLTSAVIDMQGFNSLNVVFAVGQTGDTLSGSIKWTLKLTHSDSDTSGFTDVTLAELNAGAATVVIDSNLLDESVYSFGYSGSKRYVKAVATATGTHTNGTPMAILAMRAAPAYSPVQ